MYKTDRYFNKKKHGQHDAFGEDENINWRQGQVVEINEEAREEIRLSRLRQETSPEPAEAG